MPFFAQHDILGSIASGCCWEKPEQPLVVGFSASCRRRVSALRPKEPVADRQSNERKETTNSIEHAPPQSAHPFEHRVVHLPDDFGWL
jgi:hypothetical protein